jgi:hypothetical protein
MAALSPSSDDSELAVLEEPALRRLASEGLIRYSKRGEKQLEQAKQEALRRLERRVRKSQLDYEPPDI